LLRAGFDCQVRSTIAVLATEHRTDSNPVQVSGQALRT
jgi:hypothetical protein